MRNYILVMFLGVILIIAGKHFESISMQFLGGFILGSGYYPWARVSFEEWKLRLNLMRGRHEIIP